MPRTLSLILMALLIALAPGCGDEAESTENGSAQETAEERERKARQLFMTGIGKSRGDKIAYFEKLISLYPESRYAPEAHFRMIQVLRHPTIGRADDALEKTRVFAHRHPTNALAVESWWWMALHWKDDAERGPIVRAEWKEWLDKTRERDDLSDGNFKAFLWLHSAYAAHWHGDKKGALSLLEEASEWGAEDPNVQVLIAFRTGSYRAELGRRAEARSALEEALRLVKEGAKGVSKGAIEDELKALSDGE